MGLLELPEALLEDVFLELDSADIVNCKRVCRVLNNIISNSAIVSLHHELQAAALAAPLNVRKSTSAKALLSTLRERQTRFRNLTPSRSYHVDLEPDEGRLYEYLEGTLLRGNGLAANRSFSSRLPSGTTLYDFTTSGEWETYDEADLEMDAQTPPLDRRIDEDSNEVQAEVVHATDTDATEQYLKRKWASPFEVKDITMDPGQDLFVAAQVIIDPLHESGLPMHTLSVHLLTLSSFEAHPSACSGAMIDRVVELPTRIVSLILQVCDDHLYIFASRISEFRIPEALITGWNWKTGQKLFEEKSLTSNATRETGLQTLEDFLLLSHNLFCAATYTSAPDVADGALVCTLNIYNFQPDLSMPPRDPARELSAEELRIPSHKVKLVLRVALPAFSMICDIGLRADPPPRAYFPVNKPLPLYPTPDSGVIIVTFDCHDGPPIAPVQTTFYTLIIRRETLLGLVTSDMLATCGTPEYRPILVPFASIAPFCRFRSTDEQQSWVCFVYHYRYITGESSAITRGAQHITVNDFDPIRARREVLRRKHLTASPEAPSPMRDNQPPAFLSARRSRRMPGTWLQAQPPLDQEEEDQDSEDEDMGAGPEPPTAIKNEDGYDLTQLDGLDDDGIYLHIEEDVIDASTDPHLKTSFRTGSQMPYISVRDPVARRCDGLMIDDSRIVTISEALAPNAAARLEVLDMN